MIKKALLLCVLICLAAPVLADQSATVAGYSTEEAMRFGERMYRQGLLPSGEPMQALVQLDIPVEGTMFSCDNCHLTSGLGTVEGTIITLPTNGAKLYRTLHVGAEIETRPARQQLSESFQGGDIRPAYTDETLADALRNGVSPNGREFDWTMPRYLLDERDMKVMVYYLKNLSKDYSPGITNTEIRFATVVAEDVQQADQDAMLLTLQAAINDRNAQSRHQESRARKGPFYKQDKYSAYRRTALDVWKLKGPRHTWREQLEAYYRETPVFGMLGGIVAGDWSPVHTFCEDNKIPCVLPITNFPVIKEDDWYTLYFSKGYYQEGEAAARYINSMQVAEDVPIVQIFTDKPESRLFAEGFRQTLKMLGMSLTEDRMVDPEQTTDAAFWSKLTERNPNAVFAVWSGADVVRHLPLLANTKPRAVAIFLSTSLLEESLDSLPKDIRETVYLTYPHRLPGPKVGIEKTVSGWLKTRNIPITNIEIQSKMFFLGWMLTGVTRMMSDDFYRDYFLDIFDMMHDENYAIANYPRVSFGPGQRYAAKGCYIVKLNDKEPADLVPVSEWVIH